MTIGIIREGKTPPDKRVPLTPEQCVELEKNFNCKVIVQPSPIRAYKDEEYANLGLTLQEDLLECDVLMGVKEVEIKDLIPNKKYFFFSHTYKKQPYNSKLLKSILDKKIDLVDYEMLTNKNGVRVVAFGRYAGIVGAYNGLRGWGLKSGMYNIKPAHLCVDKVEMNNELSRLNLPNNFKIVLTGKGRVAGGAIETLKSAGIREVSTNDFLNQDFEEPVFTDIEVSDYNKYRDGKPFDKSAFYIDPYGFVSDFMKFASVADMYVACHFWDNRAPFIFSRSDAKQDDFRIKYVADVSCDIDGPVASTLRPSTIENPFYGYNPLTETEVDVNHPDAIGVMAVDNLPCELPRDASVDFGRDLLDKVIPNLFNNDEDEVIWRATETQDGKLTPNFSYLEDYANGL